MSEESDISDELDVSEDPEVLEERELLDELVNPDELPVLEDIEVPDDAEDDMEELLGVLPHPAKATANIAAIANKVFFIFSYLALKMVLYGKSVYRDGFSFFIEFAGR